MADINITANSQSAISAVDNLERSVNAAAQTLNGLTQSSVNFNRKGLETTSVFKNIDNAANSLELKLKKTDDGYRVLGGTIKTTTQELTRQKDVMREIERTKLEEKLKAAFGNVPEIEKIVKLSEKLKLNFKDIADLRGAAGGTGFQKRITDLFEQIDRKSGTGGARSAIESALPLPDNSTTKQQASYNSNLRLALKSLEDNQIAAARLSTILKGVQDNAKIPNLDFKETNLVAALLRVKAGLKDIANTSDSALLSLRNFARIGEALLFKIALAEIQQGLREAVSEAIKFQIAIANIRTVSQENQRSSSSWAEALRNVSDQLGTPQADVAEAAYRSLQNQTSKTLEETAQFVLVAGELARVTGTTAPKSLETLSSVLNGYQENVGKAELRSAQLFKIIELGRVSGDELTSILGRATPLAFQLGIAFEELGAGITVLTRQGVKPAEAVTQLTNIMNKLIKSTQDMDRLLKSFGFNNGQAAIQTLGFTGVLKKLEEVTRGSATEISELFNGIRDLKGFVGLTNQPIFSEFEVDANKIRGAKESFDLAKSIRAEPAADKLIKELNRAKNYLINDFGSVFIDTAAKITDNFRAISLAATYFGEVVKNAATIAVPALIAYTTVAIGASAATSAFGAIATVTTGRISTMATAAGVAAINLNRTSLLLGSIGLGLGFFAGRELFDTSKDQKELDDLFKRMKKVADFGKSELGKKQDVRSAPTDSLFQNIGKNAASALAEVNNELDNIRGNLSDTNQELGTQFSDYTNRIRENVGEYSRAITDARRQIKSGEKDALDFAATLDQIIGEVNNKYGNPQQRLALRATEAERLREEVIRAQDSTDEEEVKSAQNKLKRIAQLYKQNFEDLKDQQINVFKNAPIDDTTRFSSTPNRVFNVDITPLQKQLNNLESIQYNLQQAQLSINKQKMKDNEELELSEKRKLKLAELQVKEAEKLTFLSDGKVKKEFIDPKTLKPDIDKLYKSLEIFDNIDLSQATPQLESAIQKAKELRVLEIELIQSQARLAKEQNDLVQNSNKLRDAPGQLSARKDALNTEIFGDKGALQTTAGTLQQLRKVLQNQALDPSQFISNPALSRQQLAARDEADRLAKLAQTIATSTTKDPAQIKEFTDAYSKFVESIGSISLKPVKLENGTSLSDLLNLLRVTDFTKQFESLKEVNDKQKELTDTTRELYNLATQLDFQFQVNSKSAVDNFGVLQNQVDATNEKVRNLILSLQQLGGPANNVPNSIPGFPEFDEGGVVGGKGGQDNVLARVGRGEFIMNSEASAQFRPLLETMNSSKMFGSSGSSSSGGMTIGDIHINNVGGNSSVGPQLVEYLKRARRTGAL